MRIEVDHHRVMHRESSEVFADLVAMGTPDDAIWPTRRMPFIRDPGPLRVGVTRERHGAIRAVLDEHVPDERILWRARTRFIEGSHGFRVARLKDGNTRVTHTLRARAPWWFAPIWAGWMARMHDRIVIALLERLAERGG